MAGNMSIPKDDKLTF